VATGPGSMLLRSVTLSGANNLSFGNFRAGQVASPYASEDAGKLTARAQA